MGRSALGGSGISRSTSEGTSLELAFPISVVLGEACCLRPRDDSPNIRNEERTRTDER